MMDSSSGSSSAPLLINNFMLAYFLGLCPFLGVSGRLATAFGSGWPRSS